MAQQTEPVYYLKLPRSVAMLCLGVLRKFPLEQVEVAHATLAAEIERAEIALRMAERSRIANEVLLAAERQRETEGTETIFPA